MTFADYWKNLGPQGQEVFAHACKASVGYLYLVAKGHKRPGPQMAISIERVSGKRISRGDLRPDLWGQKEAA